MPRPLRIKLLLLTACAVVMLQACSPNIAIELFNNAGIPLSVTGCKEAFTVLPGKVGEVKSIYQCSDKILVDGGATSWSYRLWTPSHNTGETGKYYYHSHKWGFFNATLTVRLQINDDHRVFVLPEGSDFPAKGDIPQPIGFPWHPISST